MPTPFSIASSTTPTGLISPATACDAPAPPRLPRIDHPSYQMQKIIRQRGTGPRATSCRNTGRHHLGMPGRLRRNPQVFHPVVGEDDGLLVVGVVDPEAAVLRLHIRDHVPQQLLVLAKDLGSAA